MAKNKFESYSREQLIETIRQLEKNRYGLVWEEKREYVAEQCEQLLPVLDEDVSKKISLIKSKPTNIIIEGDNYHALYILNYTHKNKIDVIYIDPPYNTGKLNEWKYNDRFVDINDTYRHSKWISFMYKRLKLAKKLLNEKGVIFISIDDNEVAQLKLLCDKIFGEYNFLGKVIVQTATDNNPSQIATEHEYLVAYALKKENQKEWESLSIGSKMILDEYEKLKNKYSSNLKEIQNGITMFVKNNRKVLNKFKVSHYKFVDNKGIYYKGDVSNTKPGGYDFPVIHPKTNKICKTPPNGYRFPFESMQELILNNDIEFGKNEKTIITVKRRLENVKQRLRSIYYEDGRAATKELNDMFGFKVFNNPKSKIFINHLMSFIKNKNAIILDFFAGSGTTGHSVLELNKQDGGNRQFILCTNNENNICEEVTYTRIKKVILGYNGNKGIVANLKYFKTIFVPQIITDNDKRIFVNHCTELLCIVENTFELVKHSKPRLEFAIYRNFKQFTAIIYDEDEIQKFKKEIHDLKPKVITVIYVFSYGHEYNEEDFENFTIPIEIKPIPEAILNVYRKNEKLRKK
jgi:adenine-specific DNA-methyltransferase